MTASFLNPSSSKESPRWLFLSYFSYYWSYELSLSPPLLNFLTHTRKYSWVFGRLFIITCCSFIPSFSFCNILSKITKESLSMLSPQIWCAEVFFSRAGLRLFFCIVWGVPVEGGSHQSISGRCLRCPFDHWAAS
jgi:hypothetical protein